MNQQLRTGDECEVFDSEISLVFDESYDDVGGNFQLTLALNDLMIKL